jgi:hypothetical protein
MKKLMTKSKALFYSSRFLKREGSYIYQCINDVAYKDSKNLNSIPVLKLNS